MTGVFCKSSLPLLITNNCLNARPTWYTIVSPITAWMTACLNVWLSLCVSNTFFEIYVCISHLAHVKIHLHILLVSSKYSANASCLLLQVHNGFLLFIRIYLTGMNGIFAIPISFGQLHPSIILKGFWAGQSVFMCPLHTKHNYIAWTEYVLLLIAMTSRKQC